MHTRIEALRHQIEPARLQLLAHPVYARIRDLQGLQQFTQTHVFAVWDFMSLLKSLQNCLTSVSVPWVPVGTADTRYLINEIVLGEESDVDEEGQRTSHFELYIKAMRRLHADTAGIDSLLSSIQSGTAITEAIDQATIPEGVKAFLRFTFDIAMQAPPHIKAAVFTFGREDLIPSMFHQLLAELHAAMPDKVSTFKYYIERHIEVDGDHHSHLALQMVAGLCGDDDAKWNEAAKAAQQALAMRGLLWDSVGN